MLDSKYIYLHEMLELGPMWLKKGHTLLDNKTQYSLPNIVSSPSEHTPKKIQRDVDTKTKSLYQKIKEPVHQPIIKQVKEENNITHHPLISDLAFYAIVAQGKSKQGHSLAFLSLSPSLDEQQPVLPQYKDLLKQMLLPITQDKVIWYFLRDSNPENWLKKWQDFLNKIQADHIIIFSEESEHLSWCTQSDTQTTTYQNIISIAHPAKILRHPSNKKTAWAQLKQLIQK